MREGVRDPHSADATDSRQPEGAQAFEWTNVRNRKPRIERREFERAHQVAAPAVSLATTIVKDGLADKVPQAVEILKAAGIPISETQPAAVHDCSDEDHQLKGVLIHLIATVEQSGEKWPVAVQNEIRHVMKTLQIQPEQMSTAIPLAPATKLYHVEKCCYGQGVGYAVIHARHKSPVMVLETESEALTHCDRMNSSPVACLSEGSLMPQHASPNTSAPCGDIWPDEQLPTVDHHRTVAKLTKASTEILPFSAAGREMQSLIRSAAPTARSRQQGIFNPLLYLSA
jgi:hypothetical protein